MEFDEIYIFKYRYQIFVSRVSDIASLVKLVISERPQSKNAYMNHTGLHI